MAPGIDAPPAHRLTRRWAWIIAVILLALYAGMTLAASMGKGVSFDEGEELAVGYDIWLHHDFRMEGANGDFVKRWATLPFLVSKPTFPSMDNPAWRSAAPYVLGYRFLFSSGNVPPRMLLQARVMVALLGIATGLLVFYCSMEMFGPLGGLFSLALFVFSPDMLAFGGVVSTEMSICLTLLGSTWCIWRLLQRISWGRLVLGAVFLPLLFLAKATALVIFPITTVLLAVKLISGQPLEWRLGPRRIIHSRATQAAIFFALFVINGLWCWLCLWAHYDFRYAASPNATDPGIMAWVHTGTSPVNPSIQAVLSWGRRTQVLPEGYLDGIELLLSDNQARETFINGVWSVGSTPTFFPYTVWAKTPPVLWLLLILGLGWWIRRLLRSGSTKKSVHSAWINSTPWLIESVPYVALILVFVAVAQAQHLDIAHRHILPIYPPIDILAGGTIGLICLQRNRWTKGVIALLLFWYVGDSMAIYPNYLAYFSPSVGGSSEGYKRLAESSLDWGMDLPGLKSWLDKNNPGDRDAFYLSYFGTDNPDYYGIKSTRLPSFPAWQVEGVYSLDPGIYAISATLFESFDLKTMGPWNTVYEAAYQECLSNLKIYDQSRDKPDTRAALLNKFPDAFWQRQYRTFKILRFGRVCAWLRHHRQPDDNVGHSILIWRLKQTEINDALYGKPAELEAAPLGRKKPMLDLTETKPADSV